MQRDRPVLRKWWHILVAHTTRKRYAASMQQPLTKQLNVGQRLEAHVHARLHAARHAAAQGNLVTVNVQLLDAVAALAGELERMDAMLANARHFKPDLPPGS